MAPKTHDKTFHTPNRNRHAIIAAFTGGVRLRDIIWLLVILTLLQAGAWSVPAPAPPKKGAAPVRKGRDTKVIDDGWTFRVDPARTGETRGWAKAAPAGTSPIAVPGLWGVTGAPGYSGVAWYWRELDPPGSWIGQTVRIRFNAVAENAEVWLNGQKLGAHHGGVTPFGFDITKTIRIGARNLLAVRVEGTEAGGAGIWQGVLLMAHDEAYIADVFPYGGPLGNLRADIELYNNSDKSGDADLEGRVLSAPDNTEIKKTSQVLSLTPHRNVTSMLINVARKKLTAWSPQSPSLFYLDLAFRQERDVLDTVETSFGFRDLDWQDGRITINGEPFAPKAIAPDLPKHVVIATESDSNSARQLLTKIKGAGVNVVYLEAPSAALLALTDAAGLMVVESARSGLPAIEAQTELMDLIRRDRAHPSILAWNLRDLEGNALAEARALDPTRFILRGFGASAALHMPRGEGAGAVPPAGLLPK